MRNISRVFTAQQAYLAGTWRVITISSSVPVIQDESKWRLTKLFNDGSCDVVVEADYLSELEARGFSLEYQNPLEPDEKQVAIHGVATARIRHRKQWSISTAEVIRLQNNRHVEQAYRQFARSNGLHEALNRAILFHDISVSYAPGVVRTQVTRASQHSNAVIQRNLAQNLVILFQMFEKDLDTVEARRSRGMYEIIDDFQSAIPIAVEPRRPIREEAHLTSLARLLLEASNGLDEPYQHGFDEEYSVVDNAALYASAASVTSFRFSDSHDLQKILQELRMSAVFAGAKVDLELVGRWIKNLDARLPILFPKGFLVGIICIPMRSYAQEL